MGEGGLETEPDRRADTESARREREREGGRQAGSHEEGVTENRQPHTHTHTHTHNWKGVGRDRGRDGWMDQGLTGLHITLFEPSRESWLWESSDESAMQPPFCMPRSQHTAGHARGIEAVRKRLAQRWLHASLTKEEKPKGLERSPQPRLLVVKKLADYTWFRSAGHGGDG